MMTAQPLRGLIVGAGLLKTITDGYFFRLPMTGCEDDSLFTYGCNIL